MVNYSKIAGMGQKKPKPKQYLRVEKSRRKNNRWVWVKAKKVLE